MINFVLDFESQFELTAPEFTIYHDDQIVYNTTAVNDKYQARFDIETLSEGNHKIIVERLNHDQLTNQVLELKSVLMDDINLATVLNHCKYYPIYPEPWISEQREEGVDWPDYHTGVLNWGWNGKWVFEYSAPLYSWLLENV